MGVRRIGLEETPWEKKQREFNEKKAHLDRVKGQVFRDISSGNSRNALSLIKQFPLLAFVQADESHKATLLIAALFQLKSPSITTDERKNLLGLITFIIDNTPFDLTMTDNDGNTALHRTFWYAIKAQDEQLLQIYINIGLKLVAHITGSGDFRAIMTQRNVHNESFLNNLYVQRGFLTTEEQRNMDILQDTVAPQIAQYRAANIQATQNIFDFSKKTFTEYLEGLLADPVMLDIMDDPYILTSTGHNCSKSTWDSIIATGALKNPLTNQPFKKEELRPNKQLMDVIAIYNKFKDNEAKLYQELHNYFFHMDVSVQAFVHHDLNLKDVIALLSQYLQHYHPATPQLAPQPSAAPLQAPQIAPQPPIIPRIDINNFFLTMQNLYQELNLRETDKEALKLVKFKLVLDHLQSAINTNYNQAVRDYPAYYTLLKIISDIHSNPLKRGAQYFFSSFITLEPPLSKARFTEEISKGKFPAPAIEVTEDKVTAIQTQEDISSLIRNMMGPPIPSPRQ